MISADSVRGEGIKLFNNLHPVAALSLAAPAVQSVVGAFVSALVFASLMVLHHASANAGEPSAPLDSSGIPDAMPIRPAWPTHAEYTSASRPASLPSIWGEPPALAVVDDAGKYVLQVGAFRELATAQSAAKEMRLEELRIISTRRDDQDWYVLVLGAYAERVDAREAGEAYLNAYPKGAIWVRAAADLKKSQIRQ